ncbi:hypothetical protein [Capnocytophaga granulosa]|uniref:hypothetical protein n=1 Tax=Capnocytophaga granulosa TaxID=45242 RepID=UPI0028D11736|nr:hypothetical protein [Capnocytophaga granulosa]
MQNKPPLCWRELAARAYDYGACSSHKEPKALLNSRYELQARTSEGSAHSWVCERRFLNINKLQNLQNLN